MKKSTVLAFLALTLLVACGGDFSASCCAGPQFGSSGQAVVPGAFQKVPRTPHPVITGKLGRHVPSTSCLGKLKVSQDYDSPRSQILISRTQNAPVLKVKFEAGCENFRIQKLRIVSQQPYDDDMVASVTVSYPTETGFIASATTVLVSGVADFTNLMMFVQTNNSAMVTVSVNVVDLDYIVGRRFAKWFRLGMDFGIADDSNFEAVGETSGVRITTGSQLIAGIQFTDWAEPKKPEVQGGAMLVTKTKPTVVVCSDTPSGTAVPGFDRVLCYQVCADAVGDLELSRVTFWVHSSDTGNTLWNKRLTGDSFRVYDRNDLSSPITGSSWSLWGARGYSIGTSGIPPGPIEYARVDFSSPIHVAAGACKTFVVKMDTTGTSRDDWLRVDVAGDDILGYDPGGNSALPGYHRGSSFVWSETGVNAASNLTGHLVRNLPVVGGIIHYY